MADAIQITVNGLAVGLQYAVLLLGILLVYQGAKVVNFAHGQIGMIGGVVSYLMVGHLGVPIGLAVLAAVLTAALAAMLMGVTLGAKLIAAGPSGGDMILTLAIFLMIDGFVQMFAEGRGRRFPDLIGGSVDVFGAYLDRDVLLSLFVVIVLFAVLLYLIRSTRLGMVLRATAEDTAMTELHGWNARNIRIATWALAGALAGVAGVLIAVRVPIEPQYMVGPLITAFIAGIVGGFDRVVAPVCVAIAIGLAENWGGALFGAQFKIPVVFLGAIAVLLVVPRTWLAGKQEARA